MLKTWEGYIVKMPWFGLGVYKVEEGDEVYQSVKSALSQGYKSIDTAAVYGNEEGVGREIVPMVNLRKKSF